MMYALGPVYVSELKFHCYIPGTRYYVLKSILTFATVFWHSAARMVAGCGGGGGGGRGGGGAAER